MAKGNKPKKIDLLTIREVEIKKGDQAGQKKAMVQFAKGVTVLYEGNPVDLGDYNNVFLLKVDEMKANLDWLVENEYMTEDQAEEQKNYLDEKKVRSGAKADLK